MAQCHRYLVSGRVQGVFFRAATRQKAMELGITGHVRNLSDGRVEVVGCGTAENLEALATWLRRGPPHAVVDDVAAAVVDLRPPAGFDIV